MKKITAVFLFFIFFTLSFAYASQNFKEYAYDIKWKYANESKVHNSKVKLYYADESISKGITVCINAGHGSKKSQKVYTYCNPEHKSKFVSGSTSSGEKKSVGASSGTTMLDGMSEASANLKVSKALKNALLKKGYNVLMIRETDDVDLDNVSRTVFANQYSDIHISIHFDSTKTDKGAFCVVPPKIDEYLNMEPVKSTWKNSYLLSENILEGFKNKSVKIHGKGQMAIDLTQISYSTVPTVAIELGDRKTSLSQKNINMYVDAICYGINEYFN